jgi:hypothetical protein
MNNLQPLFTDILRTHINAIEQNRIKHMIEFSSSEIELIADILEEHQREFSSFDELQFQPSDNSIIIKSILKKINSRR